MLYVCNDLVVGSEVLSSALPISHHGLAEGLHPLALLADKV